MNKRGAERYDDADEYFDALASLYRETQTTTVPTHLDSVIRAAAHTAVKPKRTASRWVPTLALAATLVLAIGLVTVVQREAPSPLATQPAFENTGDRLDLRDAPAKEEEKVLRQRNQAVPAAAPTKPTSAPAPAVSSEVFRREQEPQRSLAADIGLDSVSPASSEERESSDNSNSSVAKKQFDGTKDDDNVLTAETWIEHIRELRRLGETTTATAELEALRQRYPDYPLPIDLRE